MIALDKEFGAFYTIFMKAKNISKELNDEVKFPFNGVEFIINEFTHLPTPREVEMCIKKYQGEEVRL